MGIELKNLSYRYEGSQKYTLRDINLSVEEGQALSIVGKNGSGKTTLAKLVIGLLEPSVGEIFLDRVNLREMNYREIARKVGLVFQNPLHQLFCESVSEEIAFGLKNLGLKKEEIEHRVSDVLDLHDLKDYRDRHPLALSEGQRKRLALASILALDPDFLVLDEPTLGQDLGQQRRLKALIKELTARGKGVIIISQDMEFISETADRAVAMLDGKIMGDGEVQKILLNEALLQKCGLASPAIMKLVKLLSLPVVSEEEILSMLGAMRNVSEAKI